MAGLRIKQLHSHGEANFTFELRRSHLESIGQGGRVFDVYRTIHGARVAERKERRPRCTVRKGMLEGEYKAR